MTTRYPSTGGRWTRDPTTGSLVRVDETVIAEAIDPANPAAPDADPQVAPEATTVEPERASLKTRKKDQ